MLGDQRLQELADDNAPAKKKLERKKVESPELREYMELFIAQNWTGWMIMLMTDISEKAEEINQHMNILQVNRKILHPKDMAAKNMAARRTPL
jgi:hypothetical protein